MEIKYEIVPEDLAYYSKEAAPAKRGYNPQAIVMIVMGLFFIFADVILALLSITTAEGSATFLRSVLPRTIIFYASLIVLYLVAINISKFAARKAAQTAGKNGLFCEHTISLADDGFTEKTEVNKSFHTWEGVDKLTETKSFVTIQVRLGASYFIPKRAFSSDQQRQAFIQAVWSHLPEDSRPKPLTIKTDY